MTNQTSKISKTPQFDQAIGAILKDLKPHIRTCRQCGNSFQVYQEDIDFYQMFKVPPPTICPFCRKKRRFAHLMRVPKFFKRLCQSPRHNEEVITVFPPDSPHKVYDFSYWHSDKWEAADCGRNYDFTRSFFHQFKELFFSVPHVTLERSSSTVNSDYSVGGTGAKNVYYSGLGYHSENIMYCFDTRHTRDSVDCNLMNNSELCYGSVGSDYCSRCIFVIECNQCMDSAFLYNCKNCSNCFLSDNLRNGSYIFNNRQLNKEEYKKKFEAVNLGDRNVLNEYSEKFKLEILSRALRRNVRNVNVSHSVGDGLRNCNKCYFVFRAQDAENARYSDNLVKSRDLMDVANVGEAERMYEVVLVIPGFYNKFSMYLRNCSLMEYCSECYDCHYCFGCVGLKNKEFYIFNQSFKESDYWVMVDKIKTKMMEKGEYGEFFSPQLGLMPYQSSAAQKYFPLEPDEAKNLEIPWYPNQKRQIYRTIWKF